MKAHLDKSSILKINIFAILIISLMFITSFPPTANASLITEYSYKGIKVSIYNALDYYYIVIEYYPQVVFKWEMTSGSIYSSFRSVKVVFIYDSYTYTFGEYYHVYGHGYVLTRSMNEIQNKLFKYSNPMYIFMSKNKRMSDTVAEMIKDNAISLLEEKFGLKVPDNEIWISMEVYEAVRDLSTIAYQGIYNVLKGYNYTIAYEDIIHATIKYYESNKDNLESMLQYYPNFVAWGLATSIYHNIYHHY